ncbi:hypothetical protein M2451_003482 [Dysgonomonas sp. PFB1-18]|uniref:hypothetical protein n=1 Tax=unclassified Dysgonomonas TaxID=2630389 RepID=UPI002476347C|nr:MULTISPECIES: hypothetical protein [unclassified Dysgonomonas]MDH6310599.1 hypothetical protein [Dysgonomonas sp. PF1-14]MDH6340450.1 hypothetical protein [Dysgonomonas sp. PF1-16]MDH6382142.1 hypothetical protein [Dysgonomonas sp. PFB1-18]MDH6399486.1 hypothetical protein [Dysgonomonas sp. PF1-23]
MGIDKTIKKKIIEEWLNAFPQLTLYSQNKLYKVVGSCILGIELIKSPFTENYSPYFVIYPIWKKNVKANFDYPIFLKDFKNKKGFQYDIPYEKHSVFFDDVLDSIRKQTPLPFEGSLSFKKVETAIDDNSKVPPLSAAPNSYLQAALQEAKLKIALFISSEEAQRVFEQINKRSWDVKHFKACGVDISKWLQSLQETIFNREDFLKQIEVNKQEKKILQLKSSDLILSF